MTNVSKRYLTPRAGRPARYSEMFLEMGDMAVGIGLPIVNIGLGIVLILPLSIELSAWFALGMAPLVVIVIAWLIFLAGSTMLNGRSSYYYEAKYIWMPKIKQAGLESIGLPLLREIYEHAVDGHIAGYCLVCFPRLEVMKELAPKSYENSQALDFAQSFVKDREGMMIR